MPRTGIGHAPARAISAATVRAGAVVCVAVDPLAVAGVAVVRVGAPAVVIAAGGAGGRVGREVPGIVVVRAGAVRARLARLFGVFRRG